MDREIPLITPQNHTLKLDLMVGFIDKVQITILKICMVLIIADHSIIKWTYINQ